MAVGAGHLIEALHELGIPGKAALRSVRESLFWLAHLRRGLFLVGVKYPDAAGKGPEGQCRHLLSIIIYWSNNKQAGCFAGSPLHLPKIGPMESALVDQYREMIFTLAFEEGLPIIELS